MRKKGGPEFECLCSAPRQFDIKTNQYQDKSAPHFLSNKHHVCSGKDPDHVDNTVTLYTTVV
jgi:hypothetical protein